MRLDTGVLASMSVLASVNYNTNLSIVRQGRLVDRLKAKEIMLWLLPLNAYGRHILKVDEYTGRITEEMEEELGDNRFCLMQSDGHMGFNIVSAHKTRSLAEKAFMEHAMSYAKEAMEKQHVRVFRTGKEAKVYAAKESQKPLFRNAYIKLDTYDRVSLILAMVTDNDRMNLVSNMVARKLGIHRVTGTVLYDRAALTQLMPAWQHAIYVELKKLKL